MLLIVLGILVVAYRYHSAMLASRAFAFSDSNITPAHRFNDGPQLCPIAALGCLRPSLRRYCRRRS
jgi:carbon starvation protein CstA